MDEATGSSQYTVLARRFRPQTFDDVVGQRHVSQSLRNAIEQGRVAHAYLFTGARGVGKTSMARILSKALNCPNLVDGNPCNECEICRNIAAGQDVDVSEIDGASNRGIDDIRQLRANVNVKSMRTKYKMYIIDEVHMLTKEAFNALLKTLEEPPPGVKFVFCTTEPTKVPDTILSRCQRFDFSTIETTNIIIRLQEIAEAEGFQVEPAAVELVARRAAGSMRDSQSLFDQLLAFGGEVITAADVHRLLGTASDDRLIEIAQSLIDRRRDAVLSLLDAALRGGVQLGELVDQLLAYLRDLMILASGATEVGLLSVSPESRERLTGQAKQWGLRTVLAALEILSEAKSRMFRTTYGRALVEMALVRITLLDDLERLDAVIQALRQAGTRVAAGNVPAAIAVPSSAAAPTVPVAPRADVRPAAPLAVPSPAVPSPSNPSAASPTSAAAPTAPRPSTTEKKTPDRDDPARRPAAPSDTSPPAVTNGRHPPAPAVEFAPGNEGRIWAQVLSSITDMLKTHAQSVARYAILGPNELELFFPRSYHFAKQYCEQPANLGRLEGLVEKITGRPVRIRLTVTDEGAAPRSEAKGLPSAARRRVPETITDPFVQQAMSVFGAAVARIDAVSSAQEGSSADVPESG